MDQIIDNRNYDFARSSIQNVIASPYTTQATINNLVYIYNSLTVNSNKQTLDNVISTCENMIIEHEFYNLLKRGGIIALGGSVLYAIGRLGIWLHNPRVDKLSIFSMDFGLFTSGVALSVMIGGTIGLVSRRF